jgi:1-acyl-sn-glycerol-3-phosphate acyltransferase
MKTTYFIGEKFTLFLTKLIYRMKVFGQENIPQKGGFILASNHISYFDPPFVGAWTKREVYFMAKQELFRNPISRWFFHNTNSLPVKRGLFDRKAIEVCVNTAKSGHGMTIFLEGTRAKSGNFLSPKPGIGMIVKQLDCPIVPAYIHGSNRLGACFIGREKLSVRYGKPFDPGWADQFPASKEGYSAIAHEVMDKIKALQQETLAVI